MSCVIVCWIRAHSLALFLTRSPATRAWPSCLVQPRNQERSIFDFGLNVKRGSRSDLLVVRVTLPPAFPSVAPVAQVLTPNVRHPWLDGAGNVTGCNSLHAWNLYSRLAAVVSDIMGEFVATPPMVGGPPLPPSYPSSSALPLPSPGGQSSSTPYPLSGGAGARNSGGRSARGESEEDGVLLPPVPHSFPELDKLSLDELSELTNDDKAFDKFFLAMPMPTMTAEIKEQTVASNIKQARANLAFKGRIEAQQAAVLQLRDEATKQWEVCRALEARHAAAQRQFDPLRLLTQLEASCSQVDDESEQLATELLNGELDLASFIKREIDLRKLYHLRKAKAERYRAQLKQ